MNKFLKMTLLGFLTSLILFIAACCVICRLSGVEKIVIPRHVVLNPSLYMVIKEWDIDSIYKEVFYKEKK